MGCPKDGLLFLFGGWIRLFLNVSTDQGEQRLRTKRTEVCSRTKCVNTVNNDEKHSISKPKFLFINISCVAAVIFRNNVKFWRILN
jgi:hypothetical protein